MGREAVKPSKSGTHSEAIAIPGAATVCSVSTTVLQKQKPNAPAKRFVQCYN